MTTTEPRPALPTLVQVRAERSAPLPPNHPAHPSRSNDPTRNYARRIAGTAYQGLSVTTCRLPTCLDAWCQHDVERHIWAHSNECDRRNRDDEYQRWVELDAAAKRKRGGRLAPWEEALIDQAEDERYPAPWSGARDVRRDEAQQRVARNAAVNS